MATSESTHAAYDRPSGTDVSSIYLIQTERWVGEDNSSRDMYEEVIDTDAGYFTTEQAAKQYIVDTVSDRNARAAEVKADAVRSLAKRVAEWEAERDRLYAAADSAGIPKGSLTLPPRPRHPYCPPWDEYQPTLTVVEVYGG